MSEIALDLVPEPEPDQTEWLLRLRATVASDIADDRHTDIVFAQLTHALDTRITGAHSIILTIDEKNVTSVRSASTPVSITGRVHGVRRRDWFGSWAAAMTRQSEAIVPELAASSLYREHRRAYIDANLHASRSAPLLGRHNVVAGAVVVYLDHPRLLAPHELDIFDEIASLAALTIRHDQGRQELLERIRHDPLTGLKNRDGLEDHVREALGAATAHGSSVGLLFVDIDDLTLVNDSLGHTVGDIVIATTAERIRRQVMSSDTVVRFGGDEFIVLLGRIDGLEEARAIADRIRTAVGKPIEVADTSLTTTISIGITLGTTATPPLQLIDDGHAAVVRAKQNGRGSTAEHDRGLDTGASDRLDRERQLREALQNGEFAIFWQPKVELSSGLVVGAEALVRWNHPELGVVGPDAFIATAERAGLIDELSDWILCQAIDEARALAETSPNFSAAVNLSATQMERRDMVSTITDALDKHQLEARHLIIELTESVLADRAVIDQLRSLRAAGIRVAIDDFGTGYSSLAYVQQLPVGIVKVDRAFLEGLTADGEGAPILSAAVAMAHALDMTATVEGVETAAQLAGLRALNVDWGQGYLFAEPAPQANLLELIKSDVSW
ncbi:MAG: bifunctional diguanylate cyclase/phosphodiesterase [Acidimicrobiia bacterium]|nr:bifunctional diguanylate cyclase/phosphodiesterase [Acidimicrobiia bacterium]